MNRAIVIVHFGTTHQDAIRKALDPFVNDVRNAFCDYEVTEVYSSGFIRKALARKHGITKPSLEEVLDRLSEEGCEEVIVQPTVLMMGIEYDRISKTIEQYQSRFSSIVLGRPLISSRADYDTIIEILDCEYDIRKNPGDAFLFMGHGSEHPGEAIFAAMDYRMKHDGMRNAYVGTVEGYPSLEVVLPDVILADPEVVYIIPMLIVAGDHAVNDMAGDDEASWKSRIEAAGYDVVPVIKGLGEIPGIRNMVIDHIRDCIR